MPRLGELLRTVFLIDILKGLWLTLKYTPQPAFTFQYPAERRPVSPRFRGVLRLQVEPQTGAQTCIVCDQCAKVCPDDLIMLGGHRADAAYWIVDTLFVTSSWYRRDLPAWVSAVNRSRAVTRYFGTQWERVLPASAYALMGPDDVAAEAEVEGMGRTFPHRIVDLDGFDHSPMAGRNSDHGVRGRVGGQMNL